MAFNNSGILSIKVFLSKKPQRLAQGRLALLLLACLAFFVPVGEARAELNFTPPQTLVEGKVGRSEFAVDPQGRATVAWEAVTPEKLMRVQVMRVDANGVPGPVHTLAEFPRNPPQCPCPRVAVDPQGRATVVWQSLELDGKFRIQTAQMDAGGNLGPVHALSPPGKNGWDQKVAVDPQGRATIVWDLASVQNVETVRLGADGTPEEVRVLAKEDEGASPPAVAVDPEGKATVAWSNVDGMRTVQIDSSGVPGPIRPISPSDDTDGAVNIVVDSLGRATISWWRGFLAYEAKSVRLDAEGIPGEVQTLSPPDQNTLEPRLAVDSLGRVTAVWEDFKERVYTVRLDEEGAPETVYPLSEEDRRAAEPEVAVGPDDRAMVVWNHPGPVFAPEEGCLEEAEFEPASDVVKIAFLGPEGAPEQIRNVSPFGEQSIEARIGVDSQGQPSVLWESFDGTYFCEIPKVRIQISRGLLPPGPSPDGPPAPSLPPPPPLPGPVGAGILRFNGGGTAKGGRLRLPVRCTGGTGGACAGQLKLELRARYIPRQLKESLGSPPWLRSQVIVARGAFQLAPGTRRNLVLRLTGFGKKLASKGSGQSLRVVGGGAGVRGSVVWVRLRGPAK
jgi:hypothetical protein